MASNENKRKNNLPLSTNNILVQCHGVLEDVVSRLATAAIDEDSEEGSLIDSTVLETLQSVASNLGSKLNDRIGPCLFRPRYEPRQQSYGFRSLTADGLEKLEVDRGDNLVYLPDRALILRSSSAQIAEEEFWTSDALYSHLKMLKQFVTLNEAGARLWTNAFFFRVRAMLAATDKVMVLSLEQHVNANVNPTTDLTGYVDYTALRGPKAVAESFLQTPILSLKKNKDSLTPFVIEVKGFDLPLRNYLPQTAGEMYACGKTIGKSVVRGALTNGQQWIFIILRINPDGGAIYYTTPDIALFGRARDGVRQELLRDACDTVAAIMAQWIEYSDQNLGESDCFAYSAI
ncbi:hypothetical protein HGRIS_012066 [Hohenbuehelia grisea]|uniref:Uncharacterized protein n=1 Tax=Hohenbuehelia grisea TaxID=104357 RepID=A0ABR3IR86_9AGAR